ncbi:receptor-type tyrosine-protein phosphatase epsilon-like [Haliotis rufescens]|uniref:receptor-type tyrosine-protein phosphatase epsilon-like n=1 Tax=Haliotis rufescens TaxID=6454 RepID=UPI00201E7FA6|nr:receptor-type tyrosine-protein phosphatase epsilon-like [Haliotis rufescens]
MEVSVLGVLLCVCMLDVVAAICPDGTYGYECGYQCHCPVAKCDATNGCNPEDCYTGWSGPTCQKRNMALNQITSASSIYKKSSNAVNGDTRANSTDVCFHSLWNNAITDAWWSVDLGEEILVQNVTIYFRTDYKVRRNGIQIYIADTDASPTDGINCYNVTGNRDGTDIPDVLNVTCSGEGRYLVLYTTTVNNELHGLREPVLDFCEVEVDVCSNGTFGADCDNYCHCDSEVCDYVSGVCPGGVCLPGWATETCDTECESGHYGANCSEICLNRNCKGDNSSCDHVTGTCAEGCKAGWNGTDCTQKCLQSYGDGCSKMCSERNCDETSPDNCDHVTGECESGCKPGWKDTDCTAACILHVEYGANCVGNCSARMCGGGTGTCPRDTGRCESGCQSGWKGEDCIQVCSLGSYGANCTGECGHCRDSKTCHHVNGACPSGCSDGWTNQICTQRCSRGTFGANCSRVCGECQDKQACHHVNGTCWGLCGPGWTSDDCREECQDGEHGAGCGEGCGHCLGDVVCNKTNGACPGGCREGYTGDMCIVQEPVEAPPTDAGVIAGSLVAIIIAVVVVIVAVVFVRRRRGNHQKSENDTSMVKMKEEDAHETGVDNPVRVLEEDHGATYYNIASAPALTVVSVDQLGERIKELQVPVGGFQVEFQKLPSTFTRSYSISQLEKNKGKNKYRSYYPYDATRVVLKEVPDQPGSDYINASYIDGHSQPKAYIAAQAPNAKTLTDFWRMIWEQNCTRIVMLTNLMELGRLKCDAYWSDISDMRIGDFVISVTDSRIRAHWAVRELVVTEKKANTTRRFHHFHFTTWPDHGTPEETAFTEFLWLVRTSYNTQDDPLLVHCSAGIGRTGTYIAVDYLLDQALAEDRVDVFGCVSRMRDQRKGMIQTEEQYTCVYMALYETLVFGNTSISVEEFRNSRNMKGTFSTGRMPIAKFIEALNTQRKEQSQGTSVKGRVWINGRTDILAVSSRSHLSVKGYLLTEAPSVTTASLFWKLTEEQESSTVIVLPDSHQSLSSFVPSTGDSLDLDPVTVRCSTEVPINSDITLLNIHREMENSPTTLVRVYVLNILPQESPSTFLELLEQVDRHTDVNPNTVTVLYSDGSRQNGAMLCILNNIVLGLKHDKRVEIYNNMRAVAHCLDQDITQADVSLCYDMASAYIESQNIYANM